jgi:hypothetical protein
VIRRSISPHIVMLVEGRQPLRKHLALSLLTSYNIGVELAIVNSSQVVDVDVSISILVKFGKSLVNHLSASCIHGSTDLAQKFVVLDDSIPVSVESFEKLSQFGLVETKHKVSHCLGELVLVEG